MALSVVVRLLAAVWPLAVLLAAVGPLELDEVIPVGVVAVRDKMVFQEDTNFIPTYWRH